MTASSGEALSIFDYPKVITTAPRKKSAAVGDRAAAGAARDSVDHVQQTTTSQGSVFVRGLTGQRVVALMMVFATTIRRFAGPTQYCNVPVQGSEPSRSCRPSSVQYGSDGLGGRSSADASAILTIRNRISRSGRHAIGSGDLTAAPPSARPSGTRV